MERLNKLMAARGLCSRREADELISKGWVVVDGQIVETLGQKVPESAKIELSPEALKELSQKLTVLIHKPVGYVSGQAEEEYKPAITLVTARKWAGAGVAPRVNRESRQSLAPAGRLDIDSRGLLVLTQDGQLARKLISADSPVEKEYEVWVEGKITAEKIVKLRHGLSLDGKPLKRAKVKQASGQKLIFILTEGKKRQIRRMCELVGLEVKALVRTRIGKVKLGGLPEGQWRTLKEHEEF
jgi:23S rRNA pseudouridine2604 synthase